MHQLSTESSTLPVQILGAETGLKERFGGAKSRKGDLALISYPLQTQGKTYILSCETSLLRSKNSTYIRR